MRRLFITALITVITALLLPVSATAMFVPDSETTDNRDERQIIVKTYTLSPGDDPEALIEGTFRREGFDYSFTSIVKNEKTFEYWKIHSETITIETATDDLSDILDALDKAIAFDDGEFNGILRLDHTTLRTEASGYSTIRHTVSETKVFEGLDRNDPSFIPGIMVKNGVTLALQSIDWSAQGTAMSGDALVTTSYTATAVYSAPSFRKVADGYITTAEYTGEVKSSGIASVEYTLTYVGEPVPALVPVTESAMEPEPEHVPDAQPDLESEAKHDTNTATIFFIIAGVVLLLLLAAIVVYLLTRKNVRIYSFCENGAEGEYELIGRQRITASVPDIDLRLVSKYPQYMAVIALDRITAKRLYGITIEIKLRRGTANHTVEQTGKADYMFAVATQEVLL